MTSDVIHKYNGINLINYHTIIKLSTIRVEFITHNEMIPIKYAFIGTLVSGNVTRDEIQ